MARIETLTKRRAPVKEIRVDSEYESLRNLNKQRLPKRIKGKVNPIIESPRIEKELTPEEREFIRLQEYRSKKIVPALDAPNVTRPIIELPINRKLFEVIKPNTKDVPPTVTEMQEFNHRNLPKIESPKEEFVVFEKGQINPAGVEIEFGDVVKTSLMEMAMDSM